jgi:hypothetical protein
MNEEYIKQMAKYVIDQLHIGHTPKFILENWFEQRPTEPVLVGLSHEQVTGLTAKLLELTDDCGVLIGEAPVRNCILRILASQDFSELSYKNLAKKDAEIRALQAANKVHVQTHIELSKELERLNSLLEKLG